MDDFLDRSAALAIERIARETDVKRAYDVLLDAADFTLYEGLFSFCDELEDDEALLVDCTVREGGKINYAK